MRISDWSSDVLFRSLGGAAELHLRYALGEDVAGQRADDVDAEHLVRALVRQHLHNAVGVADRARAAVGGEGELADPIVDARLLPLTPGLPTAAAPRPCVADPGHQVVVEVRLLHPTPPTSHHPP